MTRLIVDGYNLLAAGPRYADIVRRDFELARTRLVSDLVSIIGSHYDDVTVVFDGAANPSSDGTPTQMMGVRVIYSPHGVEADTIVESLAHEARRAGESVVVVTSDSATRWAVLGGTVTVVSSQRFLEDLRDEEAEWSEHVPAGRPTVRLEDRIDEATRLHLWRMLRGHSD